MKALRELDGIMQIICADADKKRDENVWTKRDEEVFEALSMRVNKYRVEIQQEEGRIARWVLARTAVNLALRYKQLYIEYPPEQSIG